jgi:hypothetical protein
MQNEMEAVAAMALTITTVVNITFWPFVYPKVINYETDPLWHIITSLTGHSFNHVFLILDVFLSKTKLKWSHAIYPFIYMNCYFVFLATNMYTHGHLIYDFTTENLTTPDKKSIDFFKYGLCVLAFELLTLISYVGTIQIYKLRDILIKQRQDSVQNISSENKLK